MIPSLIAPFIPLSDMSMCLWDSKQENSLLRRFNHHYESLHPSFSISHLQPRFAIGLDFNLFQPEVVATCSWDGFVCVWDQKFPPPTLPPRINKK